MGSRYSDGYSEVDMLRLPDMVSPLFFTAPMALHAPLAVFAPVPPCATANGFDRISGQPKDAVPSAPAAMPKPSALPPFFTCMM